MSQENVEVVRRWCASASAGSQDAPAAIADLMDPDIDYYPVRKFPEAHPCHGAKELSQFIVRYLDSWAQYEPAIERVIGIGDDRVLACETLRAEGRGSGVRLEGDLYQCFWLRHGRLFRIEDHLTLAGALRALGLEGESLEAAGLSE